MSYETSNQLYHDGVKGMKWGVRRYQNKDGSLTDKGKKRYAHDQRENSGKKKGNRVGEADPDRWVKEDLERGKKITEVSSNMINDLNKMTRDSTKPKKVKMDLSQMTDQELRSKINRILLEKQYNDMFAPEAEVAKGSKYVNDILSTAGTVLAIGSSSLGIALAIKELKG